MLSDKITEIIVGVTAAIGAAVIGVLKKYNLIHFGRKEPEKEAVKVVKCATECPAHPDIVKRMNSIRDRQLTNIEILNQHTDNHKESKEELKEIKAALKIIGENIAVLKDRSDRDQNNYTGNCNG